MTAWSDNNNDNDDEHISLRDYNDNCNFNSSYMAYEYLRLDLRPYEKEVNNLLMDDTSNTLKINL
jgi:DNA repair protein RadC